MDEKRHTRYDVEGAIKPILPHSRLGVDHGQLIVRTGLKINKDDAGHEVLKGLIVLDSEKEARQIGKEVAEKLYRCLNWMGMENEVIKGFIEHVGREHRTLQQSSGHLLIAMILYFADQYEKGWYDARNEALCEMCSKLKPVVQEAALPFI